MRKILLYSKKIITVLVLTAIMMCTVVPIVQAAVPTFHYKGFTMTKNGDRQNSNGDYYSHTVVTAYQSSNGVPGNAVAGASMREYSGYIIIVNAAKAEASSDKHPTATMAYHSYGIGSKADAKNKDNVWSQNSWTK